jgi:hypothetical protein
MMDEATRFKMNQANKILMMIKADGLDAHFYLCWEALEYFLYDVLEGEDFERLKRKFNIK